MNFKDFETTPDGGFIVTFTELLNLDFSSNSVIVWPSLLVEIPKAVSTMAQFFNLCQPQNTQFLINQDMILAVYETSQSSSGTPTVSGTSCELLHLGGWIQMPPKSTTPISPAQFVTNLANSTSAFVNLSKVNNFDVGVRLTLKFSDLNSGIGIPFIKVPKKESQLAQAFNNIQAVQQHNIIKAMCNSKTEDSELDEDDLSIKFTKSKGNLKNKSKKH
jgi:hypothetical protein